MKTPSRPDDTDSAVNSAGRRAPGRPFLPGTPKPTNSGRKRGTPNKLKAEMGELRSEFNGGVDPPNTGAALPAASPAKPDANATGAGIQDELEFLRWVWQNPEHRLELRLKACSEAAQYRYAKKRELSAAPGDGERPTMRIIIEGLEPTQPPALEPQTFQEPVRPSPPAPALPPAEVVSIRPEPIKETARPADLTEEKRDPVQEETLRRENRRAGGQPHWARQPGDPLPG